MLLPFVIVKEVHVHVCGFVEGKGATKLMRYTFSKSYLYMLVQNDKFLCFID